MVLHPVPAMPVPRAGVSVEAVGEAGLRSFLHVCTAQGLSAALAGRLFSPSFASDSEVTLFVGRLDGVPVGTAVAIRSRDASGVYNVGTLPEARRRGVGTALTWAAVAAAGHWGCDTVVLQSSAMGFALYRAMGFRTVAPYEMFAAPRATPVSSG
jgi:ribosomal protein S18 acetylase RimI-like enzyme